MRESPLTQRSRHSWRRSAGARRHPLRRSAALGQLDQFPPASAARRDPRTGSRRSSAAGPKAPTRDGWRRGRVRRCQRLASAAAPTPPVRLSSEKPSGPAPIAQLRSPAWRLHLDALVADAVERSRSSALTLRRGQIAPALAIEESPRRPPEGAVHRRSSDAPRRQNDVRACRLCSAGATQLGAAHRVRPRRGDAGDYQEEMLHPARHGDRQVERSERDGRAACATNHRRCASPNGSPAGVPHAAEEHAARRRRRPDGSATIDGRRGATTTGCDARRPDAGRHRGDREPARASMHRRLRFAAFARAPPLGAAKQSVPGVVRDVGADWPPMSAPRQTATADVGLLTKTEARGSVFARPTRRSCAPMAEIRYANGACREMPPATVFGPERTEITARCSAAIR